MLRRPRFVQGVLVVRATLILALGIAFLVSGTNHTLAGNFLATFWLMGGLLTLRWSFRERGRATRDARIAGVVAVVAAVILLARFLIDDVLSLDTTLALLGATAVVMGVVRLSGALHDEDERRPPEWRRTVLGVSEIALGVVWIAVDDLSPAFVTAAGVWALVGGTIMLLSALDVRSSNLRG